MSDDTDESARYWTAYVAVESRVVARTPSTYQWVMGTTITATAQADPEPREGDGS